MVRSSALLAALALVTSCGPSQSAPRSRPLGDGDAEEARGGGRTLRKTTLGEVGLDAAALDTSADPCEDFYQFACGGWIARTEIPSDKPGFSRFAEVDDRNEKALHEILEAARADAAAGRSKDRAIQAIGAFYGACMDEKAVEKGKTGAIDPLLRAARQVKDKDSLRVAIAALHREAVFPLFRLTSDADYKEATRVILYLEQGGLGLPDRDYYLEQEMGPLRVKYRALLERAFGLIGYRASAARRAAGDVLRIETALAKASRPTDEMQDPKNTYNKLNRTGLEKLAPRIDWAAYFAALGQPELRDISVDAPDFFTAVSGMIGSEKVAAWRSYLEWTIVRTTGEMLPRRFVDLAFDLDRLVSGVPQQEPRWKRCVAATDEAMAEYLAQPFVATYMKPASRDAADLMVREIAGAFGKEVAKLDWLAADTRQRALEKLAAMAHLIGYPKKWRSYDFAIGPVHGVNLLAARRFELARKLGKVGQPFDRSEWEMSPPAVNAYYNPNANQMVFPAGILQPPFFAAGNQVAVNLGALGMVVGHELTHGFDDSGAQFDADGNMVNWWQESDGAEFKRRSQCVVDQYARFEVLPGLKVNGRLTLGENIADLGGVKLAFRAYRALRATASDEVEADGFTEDQMFFLGVGQAWCSKRRDEELRRRVKVDPHAPSQFRVNGPLMNLPEFHDAFRCEAGRPMHPEDTCQVW